MNRVHSAFGSIPSDGGAAILAIVRPIVEGQLRTFADAHPAVIEAVDWRHSHSTKLDAFVASAAKRITTALTCPETVVRLGSALCGRNCAGEDERRRVAEALPATGGGGNMQPLEARSGNVSPGLDRHPPEEGQ